MGVSARSGFQKGGPQRAHGDCGASIDRVARLDRGRASLVALGRGRRGEVTGCLFECGVPARGEAARTLFCSLWRTRWSQHGWVAVPRPF